MRTQKGIISFVLISIFFLSAFSGHSYAVLSDSEWQIYNEILLSQQIILDKYGISKEMLEGKGILYVIKEYNLTENEKDILNLVMMYDIKRGLSIIDPCSDKVFANFWEYLSCVAKNELKN